jgi:hypothetical protein
VTNRRRLKITSGSDTVFNESTAFLASLTDWTSTQSSSDSFAPGDTECGYPVKIRFMHDREARLAHNESLFRRANERISAHAEQRSEVGPGTPIGFYCECANANCTERVTMTELEYEALRSDPTHFAVIDGHECLELERVVERTTDHVVVEKTGEAAHNAIAEQPS